MQERGLHLHELLLLPQEGVLLVQHVLLLGLPVVPGQHPLQLIARELRFRALLLGTHQTHTVARRIFNVRGALRLVAEFAGAEQCYAGYEGLTRLIRFHAGLVEETPHEAEQRRKSERIAVHWLHMSIA